MNVIQKIEAEQMKQDVPEFGPGDTVKVHTRIVEGGNERIQLFQGIVIARRGTGVNQAFTVRKISNGEGVERVFPIHSPKVAQIEVVSRGGVRRSKLNYMRKRVGKSAVTVRAAKSGWKVKHSAAEKASLSDNKERRRKKRGKGREAAVQPQAAAAAAPAPEAPAAETSES